MKNVNLRKWKIQYTEVSDPKSKVKEMEVVNDCLTLKKIRDYFNRELTESGSNRFVNATQLALSENDLL